MCCFKGERDFVLFVFLWFSLCRCLKMIDTAKYLPGFQVAEKRNLIKGVSRWNSSPRNIVLKKFGPKNCPKNLCCFQRKLAANDFHGIQKVLYFACFGKDRMSKLNFDFFLFKINYSPKNLFALVWIFHGFLCTNHVHVETMILVFRSCKLLKVR